MGSDQDRKYFLAALVDHQAVFEQLGRLLPTVEQAAQAMADTLRHGGKVMFCGNGGSAADSQHLAAEFVGRFVDDREPLAAIALTTDPSVMTCIANDYAFDAVFERQVGGLGREGDCLVGISTSGCSRNVRRAVVRARSMGITTVGLLGRDGGELAACCDIPMVVPAQSTARIQECHIFLGHVLCGLVESAILRDRKGPPCGSR